MARTDARERIKAQSVTMIGPSVYLVRLLVTMGLHNVGTAIAVLVGCFSDAKRWPTSSSASSPGVDARENRVCGGIALSGIDRGKRASVYRFL